MQKLAVKTFCCAKCGFEEKYFVTEKEQILALCPTCFYKTFGCWHKIREQ